MNAGNGGRRARMTDIEAWRTAIQYAPEPELGMVDWPRVLGLVLDELEDTQARLARAAVLEREARTVMDYLAVHGPRIVHGRLRRVLVDPDMPAGGGSPVDRRPPVEPPVDVEESPR